MFSLLKEFMHRQKSSDWWNITKTRYLQKKNVSYKNRKVSTNASNDDIPIWSKIQIGRSLQS